MSWTVETLNETVDDELHALPVESRARFARICDLIDAVGLNHMGAPHVRHVNGRLWEMRMSGAGTVSRALYVTVPGQRVVILRAFVKKTQRTPPREIALALQRAKDLP